MLPTEQAAAVVADLCSHGWSDQDATTVVEVFQRLFGQFQEVAKAKEEFVTIRSMDLIAALTMFGAAIGVMVNVSNPDSEANADAGASEPAAGATD